MNEDVEFDWDDDKERVKIEKHKVSFSLAATIFLHDTTQHVDDRMDYGAVRWIAVGRAGAEIYRVAYTQREPNVIRIISAQKASRGERENYYGENFS